MSSFKSRSNLNLKVAMNILEFYGIEEEQSSHLVKADELWIFMAYNYNRMDKANY